jgi:hypothetical protein
LARDVEFSIDCSPSLSAVTCNNQIELIGGEHWQHLCPRRGLTLCKRGGMMARGQKFHLGRNLWAEQLGRVADRKLYCWFLQQAWCWVTPPAISIFASYWAFADRSRLSSIPAQLTRAHAD